MKLKKKKEKKDRTDAAELAMELAEPLYLLVRFLFRAIGKWLN
ncbi:MULTISPECIES: hypothetical protein [unclassified Niallia]|nr:MULTISPECIES: hypothetical protein [unclassified Niallia]MDL0435839.1 hypothetical protein [Niallia sp. SS-2023]